MFLCTFYFFGSYIGICLPIRSLPAIFMEHSRSLNLLHRWACIRIKINVSVGSLLPYNIQMDIKNCLGQSSKVSHRMRHAHVTFPESGMQIISMKMKTGQTQIPNNKFNRKLKIYKKPKFAGLARLRDRAKPRANIFFLL